MSVTYIDSSKHSRVSDQMNLTDSRLLINRNDMTPSLSRNTDSMPTSAAGGISSPLAEAKVANKPSIMQSIMDSIDNDDEEDRESYIPRNIEETIQQLTSSTVTSHERFALHISSVTLSKRLAGKELFENAVMMVSQGKEALEDNMVSMNEVQAKSLPEEMIVKEEEMSKLEETDYQVDSDKNDGAFDDLYGDIGENADDLYGDIEIDVQHEALAAIPSSSSSSAASDNNHTSSDSLEDSDQIVDQHVPEISSTLPYMYQVRLLSLPSNPGSSRCLTGNLIDATSHVITC
jgi:hypothetical protein